MFNYIKLKLKNRLSGWFARYLSLGGKEVLLKAVALAIPVYASFWWHTVEHRKKIHWMKWEKLCLPKELGGLGFKHLESLPGSVGETCLENVTEPEFPHCEIA